MITGEMSAALFVEVAPGAKLPTRGSPGAAGLDLAYHGDSTITIMPHCTKIVPTGVKVAILDDHYGRIAPRSGMSVKTGLIVNAGVIDSDYRGEIKIVFINPTESPVDINPGDKVAQLIIEKIAMLDVIAVKSIASTTVRGANGFGSTDSKIA